MKKSLLLVTILVIVLAFSMVLFACNDNSTDGTDNTDAEIMAIYDTYVAYAQENGTTPLSYEEWLATIKGEKGDIGPQGPKGEQGIQGEPGHTPKITIGENGNWLVDGVDTGVKAEYAQEKVTVTFHTYGAAILDEKYTKVDDSTYTIQVNKGDALTLPVPKKAGYSFNFWSVYVFEIGDIISEEEFMNWGDCEIWNNFMPIVRDLDLWADIYKNHSCLSDDGNHVCDKCYETLDCVDNNNDHNCDYGKEALTTCSDTNNDHVCDLCKKTITSCLDEDKNHVCDICKKTLSACADATGDHVCEYCSKPITSLCVNYNEDHYCDICGRELGDCLDYFSLDNQEEAAYILENGCPICGGSVMLEYNLKDDDTYEISGANRSIVSLLGYQIIINSTQYNGKEVTSVRENAFDDYDNAVIFNVTTLDIDTDNSSITIINNLKEMLSWYEETTGEDIIAYEILEFDGFGYVERDTASIFLVYYIGEANKIVLPQKITYLGDTDDFPMMLWGSKASSIVIHSNVRRIEAFGAFSSITDIYYTGTEEQWNEVAQAGWDRGLEDYTIYYNYVIEAHECVDEDAGHFCDICGACGDENKDHYCDVCEKQSSECEDTDNNHMCNVCEKELSVCKDENSDHKCDICEKVLSVCEDTDNNHMCDVCKKRLSACQDNDDSKYCDICGLNMDHVIVTAAYTAGVTTNMVGDANNATTIGLDEKLFTVTSILNDGGPHVGLNQANNIRLYSQGRCELIIAIDPCYEIVSVKITYAKTHYGGVLVVTDGTTQIAGDNGIYAPNSSTVCLYNSSASASDQVHIESIEIEYAVAKPAL